MATAPARLETKVNSHPLPGLRSPRISFSGFLELLRQVPGVKDCRILDNYSGALPGGPIRIRIASFRGESDLTVRTIPVRTRSGAVVYEVWDLTVDDARIIAAHREGQERLAALLRAWFVPSRLRVRSGRR
ncbi:MAG: hypothetical protein ACREAC_16865 [Blastocatellia bacterium]